MKISNNKAVIFNFSIKDEQGQLLESNEDEPTGYIHGNGTVLPGLEAALENQEAGYKTTIVLSPEQAFGDYDEDLIMVASIDDFNGQEIAVGMEFPLEDGEADEVGELYWRITEIGDNDVTLDANHAYAGKTLTFDLEILEVRNATDEELDHGHLHLGDHCLHEEDGE